MHIIFGDDTAREISEKYTVLEVDSFLFPNASEPVRAFCIVENIPITEIHRIDEFRDLHEKLVENYGKRNWKFCEDALEHLVGKWHGELDTFYHELSNRIKNFKESDPGPDWSPVIDRTTSTKASI